MEKIKQWIVSHKLWSIVIASALVVCITLAIVLPITLSHKHSYGEDWSTDATYHWHACEGKKCDETKDKAEHTYSNDKDLDCNVCGAKRTQTTLAFKSGTYALTYNGSAQAFDKASFVKTNVPLEEVVVEYSSSKTEPVWTTEAPKNVGTYYVKLSVASTVTHTSCEANNLEDANTTLKINKKKLALTDLVLVYDKDELHSGKMFVYLTSANLSGVCGSDRVAMELTIPSSTTFGSGEEWTVIDSRDSDHLGESKTLSSTSNNANYEFDNTTVGKLLIANRITSAEGSGSYTATASIEKDKVVYYSVKLSRTNSRGASGAFGDEYSISVSSGVEVVNIIVNGDQDITVAKTSENTLIMYGEETAPIIIFGVKYTGTEASVSNTFTLTKVTTSRTVTGATDWKKALEFTDGGYQVVLKKNETIVEESKHSSRGNNTNYYKNDSGVIHYYTVATGTNYECYQYSQNDAGAWERRSLTSAYGSADEANQDALETTKLTASWLENLTTADAFVTFTFSEEDLMYHTQTSYTLGNGAVVTTQIALKFEDNKLAYAEFTNGTDNYTIEVTNISTPLVILPTVYTDAE